MLRYIKLWLSIGWLLILLVCYLSLATNPPDFKTEIEYLDKVKHFLAYFVLMGWFAQIYKTKQSRINNVLFFISMGVLLEILQGISQVRTFEYSDMLANTSGVILAWFFTRGRLKDVLLSFENRILN